MIIRAYIFTVDREEKERDEMLGIAKNDHESDELQIISIIASQIEAITPNIVLVKGSDVDCTDVYMKSGDSWSVMAHYDDVFNAWHNSLTEGIRSHVKDLEPTVKENPHATW